MNGFTYYTPTKVIFDEKAELLVGKEVTALGAKKVLIVYGSGSVVKSGLLDATKKSLEDNNIEYVCLDGVVPNPLLSKVYEGLELSKKENIDFILAVGGGSVIDTAKAIGMGLKYDGDVWDLFSGVATPVGSTPIGCILTIAAAGSEMSSGTVITKDEGLFKRSCGHPEAICKFALMNPSLMLTLPDYQTACGSVDIIMHTMERYFNPTTNLDTTDIIAESIIKETMKQALILKDNPKDIDARWNIMWLGSLSHNGLTGCGTLGGDWSTHNIEHELSGIYNVAHGAGLSAVWGSWARYVIEVIPHRFYKYAKNVMNIEGDDMMEVGLKGIEKTEEFFKSINMPVTITGLDICPTLEVIDEMASKATNNNTTTVGAVKKLNKQDIINIYTNAL